MRYILDVEPRWLKVMEGTCSHCGVRGSDHSSIVVLDSSIDHSGVESKCGSYGGKDAKENRVGSFLGRVVLVDLEKKDLICRPSFKCPDGSQTIQQGRAGFICLPPPFL